MRLCVLLLCWSAVSWRTAAQSRTYLLTAPRILQLDAEHPVLVQLFGYTEDVKVFIYMKSSMAPDHLLLSSAVLTLRSQNQHQGTANLRIFPGQLPKGTNHVILHVQSDEINQHQKVAVSRTNGFLFIQTDKPLYTPHQAVKVRVYSLNEELRPAGRDVFLTFRDPDHETVDIIEMFDANNGIPTMRNSFKIPVSPKLGIWSVEASYVKNFTTTARAEFEVKEYVLPSISLSIEPERNYISHGNFWHFNLKISARYFHGAPVANAEVFVRYGYITGKSAPVIIPNSVTRKRLSSSGERELQVNMEETLATHSGPNTLDSLKGKYLYVAVLLQEDTGGISQEAELKTVKFVQSPYSLSLVSTPPFIKPGLPYIIQVVVKDYLGVPVSRVHVQLVERYSLSHGGEQMDLPCPNEAESQSDGLAVFICNVPPGNHKAVLKFETSDPDLPPASQASLTLEPVAYHSPNQRYLYIDPPLARGGLKAGYRANIKVYSATPTYLPVKTLNFLVLSKGKLVQYGSHALHGGSEQMVSFDVTPAMVPSIRLLVYYILYGEGASELVADSVWIDVSDKCVNGLQTELSYNSLDHKPKDDLELNIRTNQKGLVGLSATDTALFSLRPSYTNPLMKVLRHIEQSDHGCGGGGGKDSADVFRLAGLMFITNANAHSSDTDDVCTAAVRAKRAVPEEQKRRKINSFEPRLHDCCKRGFAFIPTGVTCATHAESKYGKYPRCRETFRDCCEFYQKSLDLGLILARMAMGANFDLEPSLVRSVFPESWLWEVQPAGPGQMSVSRTLPDSITTWEFQAVGMFENGICVAEPLRVSVSLPVSIDVPLPYQMVRGEQLQLHGSVYNQQLDSMRYCVTLTVGPAICLLQSSSRDDSQRSTPCNWSLLAGGAVRKLSFTLLPLEEGEHTLTFTLHSPQGKRDILQKTLRVVPEGIREEIFSGGRLDPKGLYGSSKLVVELKNRVPPNLVPRTSVERVLTINGEVLGEFLSVADNPDGLRQLINLPAGSAEAELTGLIPVFYVYQYLETTRRWSILGKDVQKSAEKLRRRLKEGLPNISSFRSKTESSYSMWKKREPSTWLTALVVKTLSQVDSVVPVNHQSLFESVNWLITTAQDKDGSFRELSSFKPNRIMAAGANAIDKSVYLTSFVLIGLWRAMQINDPILRLKYQDDSMNKAVNYISQHASEVQSVYVRAIATYALTLHDLNSFTASELLDSLETLAHEKGLPAVQRYWQEEGLSSDWQKPDQSSSLTVETTAYVLLTLLLKGRIHYANAVLTWLTQDQHYGGGFYAMQDTVLTLEAVTEYSKKVPQAVLDLHINIHYTGKGSLAQVQLSQDKPVATPIEVTKDDDIRVSTGYGDGVSHVKLKTVYYQTAASRENCNFDLTIEVVGPDAPNNPSRRYPNLVACAKFKPPPNEVVTQSTLTVMKIELPTGLTAHVDDLKQFRDDEEPLISEYELKGNTVIITMDSVPSENFLCVGFRIQEEFKVGASSDSLFRVYEPQDRGSMCTKQYSYQEQKLQRLCVAEHCQCMTVACATYRHNTGMSVTSDTRTQEACRPNIKYVYKVEIKSSSAEGDFVTYRANVVEILKKPDKELEGLTPRSEVELVKKATCNSVNLQVQDQYLLMGASGTQFTLGTRTTFRFPLDSEVLVEPWPKHCTDPVCSEALHQLDVFAEDLLFGGCTQAA
ncbi:complement C5 [Lampris incognitus]|uniref:complement C5 n=1 Tax=Lampris incognitus TaxID=2546036 RepID=UPI0024B55A4B|nr:complement C5 [Lampris incognitus]